MRTPIDIGVILVAGLTSDRIIEASALLILACARAVDAWVRNRRDFREDVRNTTRTRRAQETRTRKRR